MKRSIVVAAASLVLCGCSGSITDDGRAFTEHAHRTFAAAQIHALRVDNVTGSITVTGTNAPQAWIDTTKFAGHRDSLDNTQAIVENDDGQLYAHTNYVKTSWFGSRGGGVDYSVGVPSGTSLHLANVSGPITIRDVSGPLDIQEVSGAISASLGRVAGERDIRINTVSGGTTLQIARNSDVTLDVKTLSGDITAFFPLTKDKGVVGQRVHTHLGNGSASIDVNAVSGAVMVKPQ